MEKNFVYLIQMNVIIENQIFSKFDKLKILKNKHWTFIPDWHQMSKMVIISSLLKKNSLILWNCDLLGDILPHIEKEKYQNKAIFSYSNFSPIV